MLKKVIIYRIMNLWGLISRDPVITMTDIRIHFNGIYQKNYI